MIVIGYLAISILRPVDWHVGPSVREILTPRPGTLDDIKVDLTRKLDAAFQDNKRQIESLAKIYDGAVILLVVQVLLLVSLAIFR